MYESEWAVSSWAGAERTATAGFEAARIGRGIARAPAGKEAKAAALVVPFSVPSCAVIVAVSRSKASRCRA